MPRTAPPVIDPPPPAKPSRSPSASASPSPSAPKARRPRPAPVPRSAPDDDLPPLCNGDRLTQPEFHRRYLRMPETVHAELIEGMVHIMASPIRFNHHVAPQTLLWRWLTEFAESTPGFEAHGNGSLILDNETEIQPDGMLLLDAGRGGGVRVTDDDYLTGTPAFVFEISASTAAYDLHAKKRLYARIGVPEYLVAAAHEKRLYWFVLREGEYAALDPDADGVYRSPTWPGLWLPADAVWTNDRQAAIVAVAAGVATDEHGDLVARLAGG